jgi:3-deoxy-D-manno-octulosonate 8-phosphate phosphatase (KDO 8-P phosphatase)
MSGVASRTSGPIPADKARRVKLVVFDVDGVLTDAGVYVGRSGSGEAVELKRFDIQDGLGIKLLKWAGLEVILVSGRVSPATELRAVELGVECHQDSGARKLPAVQAAMERVGAGWDEVAMLADDLPDLPVFRNVGLRAAVANAVPQVTEIADWCTSRPGGHGGAREFCDALLAARGDLDGAVKRYVDDRSAS